MSAGSAATASAGTRPTGNLLALGTSRAVLVVAGVAIQIAAARWLGRELFGVYGFVLGVVGLFAYGSNLGLNLLLVREVAREPESAGRKLAPALPLLAVLSAATTLLVCAYVAARDGRPEVVLAAALGGAGASAIFASETVQAIFHGLRRMDLEVPGVIIGRAIAVAATVGLLLGGGGLLGVFLAQLAGASATLALQLHAYRRDVGPVRPRIDFPEMRRLVAEGAPFGLNGFFGAIYLQVDVLLLAEWHDDAEVGLYRAATVLVINLPILGQILSRGLFPKMSRHLGDPVAAGRELTFASRVLLALSVPIAVGGLCVAEPLLVFLAGAEYAAGALPLALMLPCLPLRFVNSALGMTLSALDLQGWRTRLVVVTAAFNVAANLYAVPRWGAAGAAAVTLLTEVLLTALFWSWLRPAVRELRLTGAVVRTVSPAIVMAAVVLALPPAHVLVSIGVGAVVYAVVGWTTGAWAPSDLRRLRSI